MRKCPPIPPMLRIQMIFEPSSHKQLTRVLAYGHLQTQIHLPHPTPLIVTRPIPMSVSHQPLQISTAKTSRFDDSKYCPRTLTDLTETKMEWDVKINGSPLSWHH